jgi:predicted MPP superfamily phosphohydrolase
VNRRRFLKLSAAAGVASGLSLEGFVVEPRDVELTEHEVNARHGQEERQVPFAQITDLHLHSVGGVHRRIADEVNSRGPAFVLLTGDSIDRADRLPVLDEFLALLSPGVRKYAVLGNWEHWCRVDVGELRAVYARHDCRLLVNETFVHWGQGRGIAVTGLDDLAGAPDLSAALRGIAPAHGHVLMAHSPAYRDRLARDARELSVDLAAYGVDVMLSGHTHGGQVALFGWAPVLPSGSGRYVRGWFRDASPPLYVSRGIGTTVLPVRLGSRPELAFFRMWV